MVERWVEAIGSRSWVWFGAFLLLAVGIVGAMLAWWVAFGFWDTLFDPTQPLGISYDGRNHLSLSVLLAFVATGILWVRGGWLRDVQRLGEGVGASTTELADAARRSTRAPRAARAAALAFGLLLGIVIIPLTGSGTFTLGHWDMHHVWAVGTNVILFSLWFEGGWTSIQGWRTIARYTRRDLTIDLLDRQALASIGRIGLRGAVLWLGGCIILSVITWGMSQIAPILVILSGLLALASVSLLVPAQIARASLRDAKHAELERVRARIALAKQAALSGEGAQAREQAGLLPGLLAYEARIESVREWPYDAPTLVRFALLAVIAASSWLGGALVERALGVVLD